MYIFVNRRVCSGSLRPCSSDIAGIRRLGLKWTDIENIIFWELDMMLKKSLCITLLLCLLPINQRIFAGDHGIDISEMPPGSEVTIPSSSQSMLPIGGRVSLAATEKSQTVRFSSVNVRGGKITPIRLAIFDRFSERVRYLDLQPAASLVYRFKGRSTIHVVPSLLTGIVETADFRVQVASDRPLTIGR